MNTQTIAAQPTRPSGKSGRGRRPARLRESVDGLLITFPAGCRLTGLGKSKLYELAAQGVIQTVKVGGARRIVRASVDAWIERLIAESGTAA